jgi:hypothetical protein
MTTMLAELYDALRAAGSTEEHARKAAEPVAAYENRTGKLEADISLLKWMVGFNIAISVGLVMLALRH